MPMNYPLPALVPLPRGRLRDSFAKPGAHIGSRTSPAMKWQAQAAAGRLRRQDEPRPLDRKVWPLPSPSQGTPVDLRGPWLPLPALLPCCNPIDLDECASFLLSRDAKNTRLYRCPSSETKSTGARREKNCSTLDERLFFCGRTQGIPYIVQRHRRPTAPIDAIRKAAPVRVVVLTGGEEALNFHWKRIDMRFGQTFGLS